MNPQELKSLDHIVLPVSSLAIARKRLSEMGFTVAPDGRHPFGTENACVLFENDTYLEPLAVADDKIYCAAAEKGNRFLRRDQTYRQRDGENGLSMVALATADAAADMKAHQALGYDCGRLISFRRDVIQSDGSAVEFGVDLFITSLDAAPDFALFSCQRTGGKIFDPKHRIHPNGALAVRSIVLAGADGDEARNYLANVTGNSGDKSNRQLPLKNCTLALMDADELDKTYGLTHRPELPGLRAVAIDIVVKDIKRVKFVFYASGIAAVEIGERLVVAPADGQGCTLAFITEEQAA